MGLFDFLHGSINQKSEAELYMEQRNKDYAKRAAEYKRREALSSTFNEESFWGKLFNPNTATQPNQKRTTSYVQSNTSRQPTTCYQQQKPTQCAPVTPSAKPNCDTCGTTKSLYDSDKLDVFAVENAFVRANTRTVTASGNIIRGGFSVGDKVTIKTTLEERVVSIQQIFRQGESISYANTSSGKIAIVLSNAADIMVRKGDFISKKHK